MDAAPHKPVEYGKTLQRGAPMIDAFGALLIMIDFLAILSITNKRVHWMRHVEPILGGCHDLRF